MNITKSNMTPEQLRERHSVRAYTDEAIDQSIVNKLRAEVTMTNCHEAGLHFQLFFDEPDPFRGFSKSYGIFVNPRNYIACVVDPAFPDALERAGYFAQQFCIKALEFGLGTCYVGGTYDSSRVKAQIRAGEQLLFLVLFGYPAEKERIAARLMMKMIHRNDLTARDFFKGDDEEYRKALDRFPWLADGLEALTSAPSSLNKQPVRIFIKNPDQENAAVCAKVDTKVTKNLIDLGIGKYNFAAAAGGDWEWGNRSPFWKE